MRKPIAEMNVVPYVDVMLVLVVILMVTTPMLSQGVAIDLPQAKAKNLDVTDSLPIIVSVSQKGLLYLNINRAPNIAIEPEQMQIEIAAALKRNPERKVFLKGDRDASYDLIMQAMVLLQESGVPSIGLETHDGNS